MFAIVGATGTGKSALSLRLAEQLAAAGRKAAIINADAMQLYRGMDIGTAKVSPAERAQVPHHMLDVLEPYEEASVSAYQQQVTALLQHLANTETVPILVGGSGLYVNSVLYEMHFAPHDPQLRAELEASRSEHGIKALVDRLTALDPDTATAIDLNNPRRVIRALEVFLISGKSLAAHLPETPQLLRPTLVVGVAEERATLTARLDRRVEEMWQAGMLEEVTALIPRGLRQGKTASQAIGYAQALQQLGGECSEATAIATTQQLTRRYARRQVSWFKRLPQLNWITTTQSQTPDTVAELIAAHSAVTAASHGLSTGSSATSPVKPDTSQNDETTVNTAQSSETTWPS